MNVVKKVIHISSVHRRYDTRIFLKQCRTLAASGYDVNLIVADGKGDETKENVKIYDIGVPKNRLSRIFSTVDCIFNKAVSLQGDIFHLHDPELLKLCRRLKKNGKVIFDFHEDVPIQILGKPYLNYFYRITLSKIVSLYERLISRKIDGIVTATAFIRDKFAILNQNTIDINNYPILSEFNFIETDWSRKKKNVCYVGDISIVRGVREMVKAMGYVRSDAHLKLGGNFSDQALELEVKKYRGWGKVDALGWLNRDDICNVIGNSMAGLVLLHPLRNYLDALPVKMFEYMNGNIPVIASSFPLWEEIITANGCGICVDPMDIQNIAQAIDFFINNPFKAQEMGFNGRNAVLEKYNWENESKKLLNFYYSILNNRS